MKVINNLFTKFKDLEEGDYFEYCGDYYIKITDLTDDVNNYNAIDIQSGNSDEFGDENEVCKITDCIKFVIGEN